MAVSSSEGRKSDQQKRVLRKKGYNSFLSDGDAPGRERKGEGLFQVQDKSTRTKAYGSGRFKILVEEGEGSPPI